MKWVVYLLICILPVLAQPTCEESWNQANEQYRQEHYRQAFVLWQHCQQQGLQSADLFYNMANASFRDQKIGQSIAYYLGAQKRDPANEDIQANLRYAQSLVVDQVPENQLDENPVLKGLWQVHHFLSLKVQLLLLGGIAWVFAGMLLIFFMSHHHGFKRLGAVGMFLLGLLSVVLVMSIGTKIWMQESEHLGVVAMRTSDVMSGPGTKYQVLHELHEGTTVELKESNGEWIAIKLGDQVSGFVKQSDLVVVP